MGWKSVQFDWNRARAFLVTAEEGSFSRAADALGVAQPTIGRQVGALEQELGVVLLERVGNRLALTTAGLELAEHARAMGEAASRLSLAAAGQSTELEGAVCITASELISAYVLPVVVGRIRREHPGIQVEVVASNALRNLQRREADIAIRNTAPTQEELIAQKLPSRAAGLYASRQYLASLPAFHTAQDLVDAEFFGFEDVEQMVSGLNAFGVPVSRRNVTIVADNHLVQWQMARAGLGICFVMEEVGDADPAMQRVVPEIVMPVPMYITSHRELRTSRRIRVVFDLLVDVLKNGS